MNKVDFIAAFLLTNGVSESSSKRITYALTDRVPEGGFTVLDLGGTEKENLNEYLARYQFGYELLETLEALCRAGVQKVKLAVCSTHWSLRSLICIEPEMESFSEERYVEYVTSYLIKETNKLPYLHDGVLAQVFQKDLPDPTEGEKVYPVSDFGVIKALSTRLNFEYMSAVKLCHDSVYSEIVFKFALHATE